MVCVGFRFGLGGQNFIGFVLEVAAVGGQIVSGLEDEKQLS